MKKFLLDFLIYGVSSVLAKIAAIFLIPVYTNILTKEEYGAMVLITACKGMIDLFSNLNIHSGIARDYYEVPDQNRKKLVSTGLFSIIGCSLFTCTVVLLCSNFIVDNILGISNYILPFMVMAFTIPAGSLLSYVSILTRFKKKPTLYAIGTTIQLALQLTITVLGVAYFQWGIISFFIGVLIGEMFSILYLGHINKALFEFSFERKYIKKALLFAIPTLPAILAGWFDSSFGQVLVAKYVSIEELGVYSLALQFTSVFTLISGAFMNVWTPYLYESYKKANFNREMTRIFVLLISVFLTIISFGSCFCNEIIVLMSNSGYLNARLYFPLLCIPMCIYVLFPFASSGVSLERNTKHIGVSYVLGSVLNIVILLLGIKKCGVITVPIALAVSRIFTFFYLYTRPSHISNLKLPVVYIIFLIFSGAAFYVIQFLDAPFYARSIAFCISITLYLLGASRYGITISLALKSIRRK